MPVPVALAVAALLITLLITVVIALGLVFVLAGERRELYQLRSLLLETIADRAPDTSYEAAPVTNVLDSPYDGS